MRTKRELAKAAAYVSHKQGHLPYLLARLVSSGP